MDTVNIKAKAGACSGTQKTVLTGAYTQINNRLELGSLVGIQSKACMWGTFYSDKDLYLHSTVPLAVGSPTAGYKLPAGVSFPFDGAFDLFVANQSGTTATIHVFRVIEDGKI